MTLKKRKVYQEDYISDLTLSRRHLQTLEVIYYPRDAGMWLKYVHVEPLDVVLWNMQVRVSLLTYLNPKTLGG